MISMKRPRPKQESIGLAFRKKFPNLIPLNNTEELLDGFITILGHDFRVHVTVDDNKNTTILGNWKLHQLLQNEVRHFRKNSSLVTLLHEIEAALEQQLKRTQLLKNPVLPISYYGTIIKQIQDIGWDKISFVDEDLKEVHLLAVDKSGRSHSLQLEFPFGFPDKEIQCVTGLPIPFDVKWKKSTTLSEVYDGFVKKLGPLQLFWHCMDELTQNCWVLEPENPTTKDCRRRLALSTNTSIQIIVDPLAPTIIPAYDFLGPEQAVFALMDILQKNIELWDLKKTILDNLKTVLEVTFPSPQTTSKEELKQDCGICYSYVLEEALPDCLCENVQCGQPFHQCCLYEWLRAVPTTRQSFDVLFGECPYCSKPISCKMV